MNNPAAEIKLKFGAKKESKPKSFLMVFGAGVCFWVRWIYESPGLAARLWNFSNRFDEDEENEKKSIRCFLYFCWEHIPLCAQCSVKIISEIFILHCGSCGFCARSLRPNMISWCRRTFLNRKTLFRDRPSNINCLQFIVSTSMEISIIRSIWAYKFY